MSTDLAVRENESTALAAFNQEQAAGALSHILGSGDLGRLTNEQRVGHYLDVCQSLGLNPRTRPFDWIEFYDPQTKAKKLQLYPNRSCAEQLRRQHQISVRVIRREPIGMNTDEPMFVVEVEGTTPTGRIGTAIKYVPLTGQRQGGGTYRLSGQQLANAYMKAETGAFRRLTFSMVGMASPPDVEELGRVKVVTVDGTGQVLEAPTVEQKALAADPGMAAAIGEVTYETAERAPSPFVDVADQAARPEELERPKADGPRPSFRPSDEQIKRWLGAWFAIVDETPWDTKEARALFVGEWCEEQVWPQAKRTDSLHTCFARCTEAEAGDLLAKIRAVVGVWRDGQAADPDGELGGIDGLTDTQVAEEVGRQARGGRTYEQLFPDDEAPQTASTPPSGLTEKGHASAVLTGAPVATPALERPDWSRQHSRAKLFELYDAWAAKMRRLDTAWTPENVKRLSDEALLAAVRGLVGQAVSLEEYLDQADDESQADD